MFCRDNTGLYELKFRKDVGSNALAKSTSDEQQYAITLCCLSEVLYGMLWVAICGYRVFKNTAFACASHTTRNYTAILKTDEICVSSQLRAQPNYQKTQMLFEKI